MRAWVGRATGSRGWRPSLLRAALALVLVAGLVWALPIRRPGESDGHHAGSGHGPDPYERAGIAELREGQRGPGFRLEQLSGGHASLATWNEHLVVLNFWATWCTPCTVEMPTLEALWREYRDRRLVVVGISVDRGAPRALLDPYVRNLGLTFPILLDPDMKTAEAWQVRGLPATFLVRPGGEVAGMALGAREWNSTEMRALLESMLPGTHRHGTAGSDARP